MKNTIRFLWVGILAAFCCPVGHSQVIYTNFLIYSNSFNPLGSAVTVYKTAPAYASTNWVLGGTNTALWSVTFSNGVTGLANSVDGTLLQNGTVGTNAGCALLPFRPQSGHIYDMNASVSLPINQYNWVAMGFTSTNFMTNNPGFTRFTDNPPAGYAWMTVQGKLPAGPAVSYLGRGTGSPLNSTLTFNPTNTSPTNGTCVLDIVLNTMNSKWSVAAFVNGAQAGTNGTYSANPTLWFAGLGQSYLSAGVGPTNIQWNYWSLFATWRPFITQQPISPSVSMSGLYTNSVAVTADPNGGTLSYQWYTNGVPLVNGGTISGVTSSLLNIYPVSTNNGGTNISYYCVVTNNYGAATSSVGVLKVLLNPGVIAQMPTAYTNKIALFGGTNILGTPYLGSSPNFQVVASGATPLAYYWQTNGVTVGGATNAGFSFPNCQWNSPTNFICVITNIYGAATSSWSVVYLPTPQAPYPQAVLAAQPNDFWRLNETEVGGGDQNVICNDYQSGNNGLYTNSALGKTGYNGSEMAETAAQFSSSLYTYNSYAGQIQNVDFATNGNAEFTVEAWANGQSYNNGLPIVIQGTYGSSEAFNLGVDTNLAGPYFQFYVRTAAGTVYKADSLVPVGISTWSHLVGVCDEANSNITLYVNGTMAASTNIPANAGLYEASSPISIGGQFKSTVPNPQFAGYVDDVAAYKYALTPLMVATQYIAVNSLLPAFSQTLPSTVTINAGGTLVIPANLIGSQTMGYYWTDVNGGTNVAAGTTNGILINATLTYPNVPVSWNGDSLSLYVTNSLGTTNVSVSLVVNSGMPQIVTNVVSWFGAPLGGTGSDSVTVAGSLPFVYQWQFNGTNLTDGGGITGSQTSALTIANAQPGDEGSYQVIITNTYGAVTSSIASFVVENYLPLGINGTGPGWTSSQINGSAYTTPVMTNGVLTLIDGGGSEADASFFSIPQYIAAFQASFTYLATPVSPNTSMADGATFCIQNDPRGAAALGHNGGQLGVGTPGPITPSAELCFHIYTGSGGVGYAFTTDGSVPASFTPPGNVELTNNPVDVSIYYAAGVMSVTFSNEVGGYVFNTNLDIGDLTQIVGGTNTAYVGFTGGDGGTASTQTVTNVKFVSIPTQTVNLYGANALISWPGSIVGYTLQQNTNLATTNWLNVTNQNIETNSLSVPAKVGNLFYRLILP